MRLRPTTGLSPKLKSALLIHDLRAMAQTLAFLRRVLLSDLANLVYSYFALEPTFARYSLAKNGEWESATAHPTDWEGVLLGACVGGYIGLLRCAVAHGAIGIRDCLYLACRKGDAEMVDCVIELGARNWDSGLIGACSGDNIELAKLMIDKGANNWNICLFMACCGGNGDDQSGKYFVNKRAIRLMIEHGATNCACHRSIAEHLQS
jgi:hypothetical protein